jgi:tetratricopeptide (TPR) repeat protein
LLYALACITLLWLLRSVVFPGNPMAAFAAAMLFAIHPLHTEVVANVKSRDEILSVLFICLTFIKAFRYYDTRKTSQLVWALVFWFLALLSKEYAVTLLLLIPLAFYIFRNASPAESLKATLPFLIPFGAYLALRFAAYSGVAEGAETNVMNNPYLYATGAQKLASELLVLLRYIGLLFYPARLAADYSYNQLPYTSFADLAVWLSILLYTALVVAMIWALLKRHVLGFALAFFLASLFLVSNLLFNIGAPMGERLVFHSSIGFAIALAWLLTTALEKLKMPAAGPALPALLLLLTACCAFKTIGRNTAWKNDETLFLTDVKTVPNSALVNNNAAAACMSEAKKNKEDIPLRNEWFAKAIAYFGRAIAIYPGHMNAHLNRGLCYFNMGQPANALPDWDTVRKYEPQKQELNKYLATASAYFNSKGMGYSKSGQTDSAIYAFSHATEATPERPEAWYYLASALYTAGRKADAATAVDKALKLAPTYPEALRLRAQMQAPSTIKQ